MENTPLVVTQGFSFKVIFFYFLYLIFRGLFRTYSTIKVFKDQVKQSQEEIRRESYQSGSDVFEAEYTVVDSDNPKS